MKNFSIFHLVNTRLLPFEWRLDFSDTPFEPLLLSSEAHSWSGKLILPFFSLYPHLQPDSNRPQAAGHLSLLLQYTFLSKRPIRIGPCFSTNCKTSLCLKARMNSKPSSFSFSMLAIVFMPRSATKHVCSTPNLFLTLSICFLMVLLSRVFPSQKAPLLSLLDAPPESPKQRSKPCEKMPCPHPPQGFCPKGYS